MTQCNHPTFDDTPLSNRIIKAIDFFFASTHLRPNPRARHRPPPSSCQPCRTTTPTSPLLMGNRPSPLPPPRGRRTMPQPRLTPLPLPCTESRRLSLLPWLPHARPWMRHGHVRAPLPSFGRRRRPSLITWNNSSPVSKGSQSPRMTTMIAPSTTAPTPTPPTPCTCMRRLLAYRTYDRWS
jgi:hypothetical protein